MSGIRCPMCDYEISECQCEDRYGTKMMEYCTWKHDEWHDKWDTSCGQGHQFMEGGPRENFYVYCPYCGKLMMAVKTTGGE